MQWESKIARDVVMFGAGLAGFGHEVIATQGERPTLLLACLALMGVPFMLRRDESEGEPPTETSRPPREPQPRQLPESQPTPPNEPSAQRSSAPSPSQRRKSS